MDTTRKKLLLSEYARRSTIVRDGTFTHLDLSSTAKSQALVYCQTFAFLKVAVENPCVSCIITTPELATETAKLSSRDDLAVATTADPRLEYFLAYKELFEASLLDPDFEFGIGRDCKIHPTATISIKAQIGDRVHIGPGAVIEDYVKVGDDVFIGPNVVLGADGLLTLRELNGHLLMIKHAGSLEIANSTVILAGAVVAKSLYSTPTRIADNCQIGILSTVGHGAQVGTRSVISGNCVIAGRAVIGADVTVGASVSVAQGVSVGDRAQIKMGSVVIKDVAASGTVSGNFAVAHKTNMQHFLAKDSR